MKCEHFSNVVAITENKIDIFAAPTRLRQLDSEFQTQCSPNHSAITENGQAGFADSPRETEPELDCVILSGIINPFIMMGISLVQDLRS